MLLSKGQDYISLVSVDGVILFFNQRDGPYFPTLKLLHKCTSRIVFLKRISFTVSVSLYRSDNDEAPSS